MSDAMKSLFYLVFPLVSFVQGTIKSESPFCQATGYVVQWCTESAGMLSSRRFLDIMLMTTDWAVLMIAIHSAIYIFRPGNMLGEGGLYRYRYYAYVGWILFPTLMASLAFVNDDGAYGNTGTLCVLPIRPFW